MRCGKGAFAEGVGFSQGRTLGRGENIDATVTQKGVVLFDTRCMVAVFNSRGFFSALKILPYTSERATGTTLTYTKYVCARTYLRSSSTKEFYCGR